MKKNELSLKVILPFIASIVLIVSMALISIYTLETKHINELSIEGFEDVSKTFEQIINKNVKLLEGFNRLIQKDENLINLYMDKNREWLFLYLYQTYLNFNTNYNITHFYIHDLNKTNFVRVHNKDFHSDTINRYTLNKVIEKSTTISGVEFSMNHNYTLRVVSPLFNEGDIVGYIELGEEIDKITNDLSGILNNNIIFTIDKNLMDTKSYKKWEKENSNSKKYTELDDYYIPNSIMSKIVAEDELLKILNSKENIRNIRVTNNGLIYDINSESFYDVTGKEVGKFYVLVDVTNEIKELNYIIIEILIILLILIILIVYFYYKYINKIDTKINNYVDKIEFNYEFEQYVNKISKHLIHGNNIDKCVDKTLEALGTILNAHRAYLFLFRENCSVVDNTHEWCSVGTKPEMDNLQNIPTEDNSWFIKQCIESKPIVIEDVNTLPQEASKEKEVFIQQGIKSMLVYPVISKEGTIGFIGVDMVHCHQKWTDTHHSFVSITAESIANTFNKMKYEEELELSAKVFENSLEGIIITDADTNIIKVNESFSRITGFSKDELIGNQPTLLQSNWHDKEFYKNMWGNLKRDSIWEGEVKDRRKNGELYVNLSTLIMIKDTNGKVTNYIGINRDVTDLKKAEDHIKSLAYYDSLTNLPNRTLFNDRLEENIKYSIVNKEKIALLFIDLDNFKIVNDTYGHHVGDLLLQKVAKILEDSVRSSDAVSRLAGDEFTIILKKINSRDDVVMVANKIINRLLEPIVIHNIKVDIGSSIGAAIFPDDTQDKTTLIKMADNAMYNAKSSGKNCLKFLE